MSGTNSLISLYHLTDPAGWCAVIGAVPVRTLYELCVLYQLCLLINNIFILKQ